MKKTLFFLLLSFLFVACSSDSDPIEGTDTDNQKKYPISFNISGFSIESSNLKSESTDGKTLIYAIYHANGKLYATKKIPLTGDSFEINEELPIGTFHTVFLVGYDDHRYQIQFEASNYFSDICESMLSTQGMGYTNVGLYRENMSFEIKEDGNAPKEIVLKPMWSILNLNVTDAASCILPERTTLIKFSPVTTPLGFYVKDGSPAIINSPVTYKYPYIGVTDFIKNKGISNIPLGWNPNYVFTLHFYTSSEPFTGYEYIGKKDIWTGAIEHGKIYTLKGELGDATTNPMEQDFSVSFSGLEEVPEIPF